MTRTHYLVLTLAFAFCTSISSAQLPTGTPPFGSFGGGPDIINLANLNSHITVPVLHKAGRAGFNLTYDLSYDTSVWYPVGSSGSQSWQSVWNWGWTGQTQVMSGYIDYKTVHGGCNLGTKTDPYVVSWTRYTFGYFHDQFGGLHPIGAVVSDNTGQCPNDNSPSSGSATVTDGSGYTYYVDSTPAATVYPTVGGSFQPPLQAGIGATTATDRNGNQTSVSSNGAFTDTLGLVALTVSGSGTPSSPLTFTYTAPSSAPAAYTMKYTAYTVQTNFGCSGIAEYGPTSNNLVSEIDLPDSSKYTFAYEPTPGAPSNVTGRLKSVTLPTGGTITYSYTGGSNGITCADGSAATLTRATPDGTWSYAQVKGAGAASTTTVTDPQGNQTVIQFQGIYETQRQVYQGSTSGTLLLTTNTCYNAATSPCNGTAITLPITQRTVITTLPGNLQSKHFDSYSAYGMPTESDDYDYGSGAPGALLRAVTMTYAPLGNNINPASNCEKQRGSHRFPNHEQLRRDATHGNFRNSPTPRRLRLARKPYQHQLSG